MQLSAIIVIGTRTSSPLKFEAVHLQPNGARPTSFACVEIFGHSVLQRTIERLQKAGVRSISLVTASGCDDVRASRNLSVSIAEQWGDRWRTAERLFKKEAQRGIDTFLIAELGAYAEFDLSSALQFHLAKRQAITSLHDSHGPLSYWLADAAQLTASNRFPLPNEEEASTPYLVDGHVNRLADARDFRQLVVDSFLGRCTIKVPGREIKAGVWIDDGAHVHKTARLVAPSYIGCHTRVERSAVITRFTNLERNCCVGQRSLVADASLLPHTIVGRGLDVSTAVVDGNDFFHLNRNIRLRIEDPSLISDAAPRKVYIPPYLPEYEDSAQQNRQNELEYSQYLSRAAGRLLEVFKGEV